MRLLVGALNRPRRSRMVRIGKKKLVILFFILVSLGNGIGIYKRYMRKRREKERDKRHIPYGIYEAVLKRPFDMTLAGIALIVFGPVMAITALLVKIRLGSPVLFTQKRPGRNGKIFMLYKFRTMNNKRDANGRLLSDEERLTDFGKVLRSTSLDELPELYNILLGDMSIVGPRPLLVEYLPRYSEYQKHRHDVRPGLTGLAQVNGRNKLSWEERFEDDVKYVERITFWSDICIMLKTIIMVLKRDGINSDTSTTMDIFMGN